MPRETRFKFKRGDKWVYAEDLPAAREAEQRGEPIDVKMATLPPKRQLDKEHPLAQLFFEDKRVRGLIVAVREAAGGPITEFRVRQGLTPAQERKAKQIIEKYGGSHV